MQIIGYKRYLIYHVTTNILEHIVIVDTSSFFFCLILWQVADALKKVSEHKKALEEAEKIEQEFMTLVTGQRRNNQESKIPEVGILMCVCYRIASVLILFCVDEKNYFKNYFGKSFLL